MADHSRMPTLEEERILKRNGVDLDGIVVRSSSADIIVVKKLVTGDLIFVSQGDKPWNRY